MKANTAEPPGFVSGSNQLRAVAPDLHQDFFESNPAVMWIKDEDGRYVQVNRQLESVYHISGAAIFGHTDSELLPPETAKELRDHDLVVLKHNQPFTTIEHIPDGDGVYHDWKVVKFPFSDGRGRKYVGGFAVRCDEGDTARKQAAFSPEMEALQRSAQVGVLAAAVAHDANNLLTVVLGHAGMLHDRIANGDDSLDRIERACKAASKLLRKMASLTKGQTETATPIDLNACVQEVIAIVGGSFAQRIQLRVETLAPAAMILGDRLAIEQVLLNLIINARDALPKRGEIFMRTFNCAQSDEGKTVSFEIQDNGCGIAPEHLGRIFEPFFTTKRNTNGFGLGLSSVKRIVEELNGTIHVESAVGKGTRVTVTFPLVTAEMRPSEGSL